MNLRASLPVLTAGYSGFTNNGTYLLIIHSDEANGDGKIILSFVHTHVLAPLQRGVLFPRGILLRGPATGQQLPEAGGERSGLPVQGFGKCCRSRRGELKLGPRAPEAESVKLAISALSVLISPPRPIGSHSLSLPPSFLLPFLPPCPSGFILFGLPLPHPLVSPTCYCFAARV